MEILKHANILDDPGDIAGLIGGSDQACHATGNGLKERDVGVKSVLVPGFEVYDATDQPPPLYWNRDLASRIPRCRNPLKSQFLQVAGNVVYVRHINEGSTAGMAECECTQVFAPLAGRDLRWP